MILMVSALFSEELRPVGVGLDTAGRDLCFHRGPCPQTQSSSSSVGRGRPLGLGGSCSGCDHDWPREPGALRMAVPQSPSSPSVGLIQHPDGTAPPVQGTEGSAGTVNPWFLQPVSRQERAQAEQMGPGDRNKPGKLSQVPSGARP